MTIRAAIAAAISLSSQIKNFGSKRNTPSLPPALAVSPCGLDYPRRYVEFAPGRLAASLQSHVDAVVLHVSAPSMLSKSPFLLEAPAIIP